MTASTMRNSDSHGDGRLAYTVPQALRRVPLSRNKFYQAVRAGEIPSVRIGGRILIPRRQFDAMFGADAA